jgi:hypothetical protein
MLNGDISGRDRELSGFVSASGFLCTSFGSSSGVLRELPKVSERIPEGFPKELRSNPE